MGVTVAVTTPLDWNELTPREQRTGRRVSLAGGGAAPYPGSFANRTSCNSIRTGRTPCLTPFVGRAESWRT
jgi:hypothetical protein